MARAGETPERIQRKSDAYGRAGHLALDTIAPPLVNAAHPLDGAVAQLGERVVRNDEVRGSIPLGSTNGFQAVDSQYLCD